MTGHSGSWVSSGGLYMLSQHEPASLSHGIIALSKSTIVSKVFTQNCKTTRHNYHDLTTAIKKRPKNNGSPA